MVFGSYLNHDTNTINHDPRLRHSPVDFEGRTVPGMTDIVIGDETSTDYAIASFRIDGFPSLSLALHVHRGVTPGLNLGKNSARPCGSSMFIRARWVDRKGNFFEEDCLVACTADLGRARPVLIALMMSQEFAGNTIQPLLRGIRDQIVGRRAVRPVNAPLPVRLQAPVRPPKQ